MKRTESDLPPSSETSGESCRIVDHDLTVQNSGMTFQRLALWTEESTLKMRMMSTLVDEARSWYQSGSNRRGMIADDASPVRQRPEVVH